MGTRGAAMESGDSVGVKEEVKEANEDSHPRRYGHSPAHHP
jgi:hypothetical protein